MSDARAIAAVTATLQAILNAALLDADVATALGASVKVTSLPPDRVPTGDAEVAQVNLFLHDVTPNPGWRNTNVRSHDSDGNRVANPALALDLHYLLSAYGAKQLDIELLLGHALQALHEQPVLAPETIAAALPPALAGCGLDEQIERVRVTAEVVSGEEMARLWSAMQAKFRPTAAIRAGVVLLERRRPHRSELPVTRRNLQVRSFAPPRIATVSPSTAVAGDVLELRGVNLAAPSVRVRFPSGVVNAATVEEARLTVAVPSDLAAGAASVQVLHEVEFGTPADPHRGLESNVASFAVAPRIVIAAGATPTAARGGTLMLTLQPPLRALQRVALILGSTQFSEIRVAAGSPPATDVALPVPATTPAGVHLLRVSVDGIESPVQIDGDPASPAFGQITGPKASIT